MSFYGLFDIWTIFFPLVIITILWLTTRRKSKSVSVVVLGDIGRSPRMQNHALSFANEGYAVDVVGYDGSTPLRELREHPNVRIRYMKPPPDLKERLPRLFSYGIKVLWQSITLLATLIPKRRSSYLLLQNPPAIPAVPICWFYCAIMRVQFVIDWHNYAYTIQALGSKSDDVFVRLTRVIEFFFGRKARGNICVSKAMKMDLENRWKIEAKVLYDRPSKEFHEISLSEKHSLMVKLSKKYKEIRCSDAESTVFTERSEDGIVLKKDRPALLVSGTSWTLDEDFGILISAFQEYETACTSQESDLPDIICIVTGKGPLKEFYNSIIQLRSWKHVNVITPWLENEDYPKLLASADLGICLHTSSSGLDLPMKLVDMFGSGLPAFAYNYECLNELLLDNRNGKVFSNANELADLLIKWFSNFPNNEKHQSEDKKFREQLKIYQEQRWHDNWLENAAPIFT